VIQPQLHSTEERTRTENLPSALAFASGSAVTQAIVSSLVKSGGHIISVNDVYGGTYRYLTKVATNSGISTTFVELTASGANYEQIVTQRLEAAFTPETQVSAGIPFPSEHIAQHTK
jgi:cystathionine gamma-lyase